MATCFKNSKKEKNPIVELTFCVHTPVLWSWWPNINYIEVGHYKIASSMMLLALRVPIKFYYCHIFIGYSGCEIVHKGECCLLFYSWIKILIWKRKRIKECIYFHFGYFHTGPGTKTKVKFQSCIFMVR
jgi:hypothetical protein